MNHPTPRTPLVLVMLLLLGAPSIGVAIAGPWQGDVAQADGLEIVHNPATPMEDPLTITPHELWRIGGETDSEEEFFGVINQLLIDGDGNLYLLDRQLSEVKVFSPDGEYLRTIGREGEGPGEFRNPQDMFLLSSGHLGVLQVAPGRVILFTLDGEPAGEHPLPRREGGAMPTLMAGAAFHDGLLLEINENDMNEGHVDLTRAVIVVDAQGEEQGRLISETRRLEFVNFLFDEQVWRTFDNRWRVGADGRIYVAEKYLPYEITVFDDAGQRVRRITRDYEHYERSGDQKQAMYDIFDGLLQNQLPQYSIKVSEHDPDISGLFPREDGSLWVLSSRGERDRPEGSLGVFDVYDADGRFVRQVTLMGEGDSLQDGYFFLGDRLYVATGILDANIASRGGRRMEEGEEIEEPEPTSIICYELGAILAGR